MVGRHEGHLANSRHGSGPATGLQGILVRSPHLGIPDDHTSGGFLPGLNHSLDSPRGTKSQEMVVDLSSAPDLASDEGCQHYPPFLQERGEEPESEGEVLATVG